MQVAIGNMWSDPADIWLVTTNSVLNTRNELVMGSGSAAQAKKKHPELPRLFGAEIKRRNIDQRCVYGTIIFDNHSVGAFQTKGHFRHGSQLQLIEKSTEMLCEWCYENMNKKINLPFPGVGCGGLNLSEVYEVIDILPMNVTVWLSEIRVGLKFMCGRHTYRVIAPMSKNWCCYNEHLKTRTFFSTTEILNQLK